MADPEQQSVLFVCSGNFYRSRLAELLFNHYAEQDVLSWRADSRGLLEQTAYKGISPSAGKYLEQRELGMLLAEVRNPKPIRFDDLEQFDLIVGLNRDEHEGLFLTRFGQIPRHLAKQGKLRYWNIDDLPRPGSRVLKAVSAIFNGKEEAPSQREESGTEHIDFAVQALVRELGKKGGDS